MGTRRGQRERWRSHPKTGDSQVKSHDPTRHPSLKQYLASASIGLAFALSIALPANVYSAPVAPAAGVQATAQNVDYISADAAYALDLSFLVLVPSWVPAPFGGPPSIDAGGGYYSLYWMNVGGEPTFLQVSGTVGGSLPAGSPYDLNNELFINATVQGYSAIQDVTPAYDAVWWVAGGVLYKVESRNSSADSLTLANSLIQFSAPSAPEPEPTAIPVEPTPEPVQPTPVPSDLPAENSDPVVVDERPADELVEDEPLSQDESSADTGGEQPDVAEEPEPTEPSVGSDGTGDPSPNSDGTGGPRSYVIGGDGTGGTIDVVIPRRTNNGTETP